MAEIGGAFCVIPLQSAGKQPDNMPVFNGHGAAVVDTCFNPFNNHIIASASEDCKVYLT
jgi:coronin-1B/1C/6